MDAIPDRTMLTLFALSCSARGRYSPDGRQYSTVEVSDTERVEWEILPAEIDELERRGWVVLLPPRPGAPEDQAEAMLTEKAEYWLKRWVKVNRQRLRGLLEQFRPGRRPDLSIEVHPVRANAC